MTEGGAKTYLPVNHTLAPRESLHQCRGLDPCDEDPDALEPIVELVRIDLAAEVDVKVLQVGGWAKVGRLVEWCQNIPWKTPKIYNNGEKEELEFNGIASSTGPWPNA